MLLTFCVDYNEAHVLGYFAVPSPPNTEETSYLMLNKNLRTNTWH